MKGIDSNKDYQEKYIDEKLNQVSEYLEKDELDEADKILKSIANRNAKWYYLVGIIHLRKQWYDSALTNISIACEMEPSNEEYASMLRRVKEQSNVYKGKYEKINEDSDSSNCKCCRCFADGCATTSGVCCCC